MAEFVRNKMNRRMNQRQQNEKIMHMMGRVTDDDYVFKYKIVHVIFFHRKKSFKSNV